jgi:hypothetical protein
MEQLALTVAIYHLYAFFIYQCSLNYSVDWTQLVARDKEMTLMQWSSIRLITCLPLIQIQYSQRSLNLLFYIIYPYKF